MATKITLEVREDDLRTVLRTARLAINQGMVGIEGDLFDAEAAIGALDAAMSRALVPAGTARGEGHG